MGPAGTGLVAEEEDVDRGTDDGYRGPQGAEHEGEVQHRVLGRVLAPFISVHASTSTNCVAKLNFTLAQFKRIVNIE